MKKVFWMFSLLFISISAVSCSSDDDSAGGNNDVDIIVGSWEISDVKLGGFSVYNVIAESEAGCFLETSFHFNNDYTLVVSSFMQNPMSENTDCVAVPEETGEWSKSEDTYSITVAGETASQPLDFTDNNNFNMTYEMEGVSYLVYFSRF